MSIWQDVKDQVSILEVISDYVPVVQKGQNYACKCPFHNDKNPSLMISEDKKIWHCFGCGAGGDVFAFVCEMEKISKIEALRKLVERFGLVVPEMDKGFLKENKNPKAKDDFNLGSNYLKWSAEFYHQILLRQLQIPDSPIAVYCQERELDIETIKNFKLGYAPKGNFLLGYIKKLNAKNSGSDIFDIDIIKKVGLLKD